MGLFMGYILIVGGVHMALGVEYAWIAGGSLMIAYYFTKRGGE